MNSEKNYLRRISAVILLVIFSTTAYGVGYSAGKTKGAEMTLVDNVSGKTPPENLTADFVPFWQVWKTINEKYLPVATTTAKIASDQDRVWGAIEGMVASMGDPYTVFFPPEETKKFDEEIRGNFGGVGMELDQKDGRLIVVAPLKNTPADRAGIKPLDKIVAINGVSTQGITTDAAVTLIRGEPGTQVTLTIERSGEKPFDVKLTRAVIEIPVIKTETKDDVFVVHLYNFSSQSGGRFADAMRDFIDSGKKKLVIDLRNNPGGYLDAAVDIVSWFLPQGDVVVTEDFKNKTENVVYRSAGYGGVDKDVEIVLIMNEGSASASEILAGALHDHKRAKIVGTQSFGKGSVQEYLPVTNETSLKVTIARWLTPNGTSLSDGGLKPDVEIKPKESDKTDVVLEKALEILKKK